MLECLAKRKEYFDKIVATGTYKSIPSFVRLVDNFKAKNPVMTDEHLLDLDNLIQVALSHDFYFEGANKIIPPELDFKLDVGGSVQVEGTIDKIAIYEDHAVIRDFKTQGKKFTADELENNIQAGVYQYAVKKLFGLPARVEFLLLRFPPQKRNPTRHLQVVEPYTESQLNGLMSYLTYLSGEFNGFTETKAKLNLKAFKDKGFCLNVCGFRMPFAYWAGIRDNNVVRTSKTPIEAQEGEIVMKQNYPGCPYFYNEQGKARNYA